MENKQLEPLNYEGKEPLYTLKEQKVCPYFDYVKLFFNLTKAFNIAVIAITLVALGVNIFLNTLEYNYFNLIIYIMVGLIAIMLLFTNFLLPYIQMNKVKKGKNNDVIDFHPDCLVMRYVVKNKAGEELENKIVFDLRCLKKKKENKKSYLLYQGKLGLILSKDNDYNDASKEVLNKLFEAKK